MMTLIRWILAKFILFWEALFSPKPPKLSEQERQRLNAIAANLSIYQFKACPFCVKVRMYLRGTGIQIPYLDAKIEPHRTDLLNGGGKLQVPCLRIKGADSSQWMYESGDIIAYIKAKIANA